MTNLQLAKKVVDELVLAGVREFCLCAGARNSPLVYLLEQSKDLKIYNFFEERSAAFFALGRMAATELPVAVVTTSGTAVAELLPAAVEATYSSLPLIMVSADRPKTYRGSGAPQTIEQVGIFSYYIEATFDLDEENSHISLKSLTYKKPIHVNVCFKEPLLDGEVSAVVVKQQTFPQRFPESVEMNARNDVRDFIRRYRPVVIVGHLPQAFMPVVKEFLRRLQAPIYAETISGLRNDPSLQDLMITSGDLLVAKLVDDQVVNSVIRIGGVPTLRFWRDLEDKYSHLPVLSLSYNYYTGLGRGVLHFADIYCLDSIEENRAVEWEKYKALDRQHHEGLLGLLSRYPHSEPALLHALSKNMQAQSVYLGNSLPIREWDLCADRNVQLSRTYANRGANGIDGQISTFMGWAKDHSSEARGESGTNLAPANWCVVGDLTTMYDLSAPWISEQLAMKKLRVVVINNRGGQIFRRIFKKEIFLNRHQIQFSSWAAMWNWGYQAVRKISELKECQNHEVIELLPDETETEMFWSEWEKRWGLSPK